MHHIATKATARRREPRIWHGCLPEHPVCAVAGCGRTADWVDAFFPYLDDHNRCGQHATAGADAVNEEMPRYLC